MGDEPSRGITYPRPRLSGRVVPEPARSPIVHLASADFTYNPRQRCFSKIG